MSVLSGCVGEVLGERGWVSWGGFWGGDGGFLRRCGVLFVGGFLRSGLFAGFIEDLDLLKCEFFSADAFFWGRTKSEKGKG